MLIIAEKARCKVYLFVENIDLKMVVCIPLSLRRVANGLYKSYCKGWKLKCKSDYKMNSGMRIKACCALLSNTKSYANCELCYNITVGNSLKWRVVLQLEINKECIL